MLLERGQTEKSFQVLPSSGAEICDPSISLRRDNGGAFSDTYSKKQYGLYYASSISSEKDYLHVFLHPVLMPRLFISV